MEIQDLITADISAADLAQRFGVNEQTIRRLIHTGKLKTVRIGNVYRTCEEWVAEYLQSTMIHPSQADEDPNQSA